MKIEGREITLKEMSMASLLSRLEKLHNLPFVNLEARLETESIEQELEERNEGESKVSRW
jgi:hypothetical protein